MAKNKAKFKIIKQISHMRYVVVFCLVTFMASLFYWYSKIDRSNLGTFGDFVNPIITVCALVIALNSLRSTAQENENESMIERDNHLLESLSQACTASLGFLTQSSSVIFAREDFPAMELFPSKSDTEKYTNDNNINNTENFLKYMMEERKNVTDSTLDEEIVVNFQSILSIVSLIPLLKNESATDENSLQNVWRSLRFWSSARLSVVPLIAMIETLLDTRKLYQMERLTLQTIFHQIDYLEILAIMNIHNKHAKMTSEATPEYKAKYVIGNITLNQSFVNALKRRQLRNQSYQGVKVVYTNN